MNYLTNYLFEGVTKMKMLRISQNVSVLNSLNLLHIWNPRTNPCSAHTSSPSM